MLKPLACAMIVTIAALHVATASAQPVSDPAPKIAAPDGGSVESIGEAVVINGRRVTMDRVVVSQPPAAVVRHYRKALDEKSSGKIIQYQLKGDQIVARRIGEHFVTVRVHKASENTSEVWIMTTPMQAPMTTAPLPANLAVPAGSRVLSNVETVDGGRRAYTVIATADAAVSATQDFLKKFLSDRGFVLVTSDESSLDASRRVLLFQRGNEDVMATIADGPKGRTLVLNASGPK